MSVSSLAANTELSLLLSVSIEAIKSELRALPADERRKLMAFMVVLEDEARTGYAAEMARRIDDSSPEGWLTAEQCKRELGLSDQTE